MTKFSRQRELEQAWTIFQYGNEANPGYVEEEAYYLAREWGRCLLCGDKPSKRFRPSPHTLTLAQLELSERLVDEIRYLEDRPLVEANLVYEDALGYLRRRSSAWCVWEACKDGYAANTLNMLAAGSPWDMLRKLDELLQHLNILAIVRNDVFIWEWREQVRAGVLLPWWLDGTLDQSTAQPRG